MIMYNSSGIHLSHSHHHHMNTLTIKDGPAHNKITRGVLYLLSLCNIYLILRTNIILISPTWALHSNFLK